MNSISHVVEKGLCQGCGTCAGVCPSGALDMHVLNGLWVPKILSDKCNSCGLCVRVCPGLRVDFKILNDQAFEKQPLDSLIGNCLGCYVSHSNNGSLRYNSSSGGLASHILVFALEQGLISGALVTRMNKANPLESESFVARTKEEIVGASKSKYCPVTANYALREIVKEKGKFAVVGLPCHLHGIRKAEKLNPELKKKIVLHIGLMCSHMVSYEGTAFILRKMHADKLGVSEISYRGKGWPGAMTIKSGRKSLNIPLVGSWVSYWPVFSSFLFTPVRCTMCPDQIAELADISLGDAWLPELRGDKIGESILITRTQFAEGILNTLKSNGEISLLPVTADKVKQSQAINLKFKKNDFFTRSIMHKAFGRQLPVFDSNYSNDFSVMAFLRGLYIFTSIKISTNKSAMSILSHFPFPLFRLYSGVYRLLSIG